MHEHLRRQGNRKTLEGTVHPDRNAQFERINAQVARFQRLALLIATAPRFV